MLALDVDGPINVCEAKPGNRHHSTEIVFVGKQQYRLVLDDRHPQFLADLAADFDLVWATAWEANANLAISPLLNLPPLPVVHWGAEKWWGRAEAPKDVHWKTPTLADYALAAGAPLVWFDDECDLRADNAYLQARGVHGLAVHVSPATGIRPGHISQARNFIGQLEGSTP